MLSKLVLQLLPPPPLRGKEMAVVKLSSEPLLVEGRRSAVGSALTLTPGRESLGVHAVFSQRSAFKSTGSVSVTWQ